MNSKFYRLLVGLSLIALASTAQAYTGAENTTHELPGCSIGPTEISCARDEELFTFPDPGCSVTCPEYMNPVCVHAHCNEEKELHRNSSCVCTRGTQEE